MTASKPALAMRVGPAISHYLRATVAVLVCALVVGSIVGQTLVSRRQLAARQRSRLTEMAEIAATLIREQPPPTPSAGGDATVRAPSGGMDDWAEVRGHARALLGGGRLDGLAVTDTAGDVLFYWPVVEGGPNRLIIPRAGEIGRIEVAGEDGPPTALQSACASLGAPSAAWAGGFACVLSHDRVGQGRSALGAGGSQSLPDGTFLAGMAALGTVGFALSLRCLHRRVVAPLGRITTAIQRIPADESLEQEDEFGAIARRLDELCEELQLAREDAQRMQNSIDYTVLRETKEISTQLRRAQRAAELDPLTGLANRRFIDERLEAVFSEQSSRGVNLAIVMLDVDNFKPLNDLAGHAAGDALLRFVGALLRGSLREGDVGVRYGGDEFVLVLVDVCGAQARSIAERLVRLFAQQATAAKLPGHVTLSAGVASLDEIGAASGAELLARADDALYRAKRGGKNIALSAVD